MDTLLCDELIQEIFNLLPPQSSTSISLVSKRWLHLLRSSITSLSLNFPSPYNPTTITSFSTFLSNHPFLSSLHIAAESGGDPLILAVSSSCPNLNHLRFLGCPVSSFSLYTLSTTCTHLTSISIMICRPFSFNWIPCFGLLKNLSLFFTHPLAGGNSSLQAEDSVIDVDLKLESLSLSGISDGDYGLGYLWRNCKNIRKLQLKSCDSLGDYSSFTGFVNSLSYIHEVELRGCRSIVDGVLLRLVENYVCVDSLLIYDGGSREGLLHFINHSKCDLKVLDLRLPLDLDNSHLIALTENSNFRGLVSLRLQSCCLVTGEGVKAIAKAMCNRLEELALINCDVVERESGLLITLGQDLKRLRKLDLSYNDMLLDKELVLMLVSCGGLEDLKLRRCDMLSDVSLYSMVRNCKKLRFVDITYCRGIGIKGVEFLVMNLPRLRRVDVEESKLSEVARRKVLNMG